MPAGKSPPVAPDPLGRARWARRDLPHASPIVASCHIFAQLLPSFRRPSKLGLTMSKDCGIFVVKLVLHCIKTP
jgi:hypothetical protein